MDDREVIARAVRTYTCGDMVADEIARVALSAFLAHLEASGRAIVPVEATEAIVEAGLLADENALLMSASCSDIRNAYRAMIAAAKDQTDGR